MQNYLLFFIDYFSLSIITTINLVNFLNMKPKKNGYNFSQTTSHFFSKQYSESSSKDNNKFNIISSL